MKKNEEYIVTCIDDTDLNSGVVKIDDMVVFVPNLLIGEKAKIKIVKVNKKYAFGIITQLLKPSINRQELTCEVAKTCGGCQLQHMKYAYQLDYKYKHVKKLFEDIEVKSILGMDSPWYYRNKAQFPVKIKDGKVLMGFYRQHSNDVVTCKECKILQSIKSLASFKNISQLKWQKAYATSLSATQVQMKFKWYLLVKMKRIFCLCLNY